MLQRLLSKTSPWLVLLVLLAGTHGFLVATPGSLAPLLGTPGFLGWYLWFPWLVPLVPLVFGLIEGVRIFDTTFCHRHNLRPWSQNKLYEVWLTKKAHPNQCNSNAPSIEQRFQNNQPKRSIET
jgi:hypothetical protein